MSKVTSAVSAMDGTPFIAQLADEDSFRLCGYRRPEVWAASRDGGRLKSEAQGEKKPSVWERYLQLQVAEVKSLKQNGLTNTSRIAIWLCPNGEHCGGWADEVRGLTTVMYLAMLTGRAFFFSWHRLGQDISQLMDLHGNPWVVPEGLNISMCTQVAGPSVKYWNDDEIYLASAGFADYTREGTVAKLAFKDMDGGTPCVVLRGNSVPVGIWKWPLDQVISARGAGATQSARDTLEALKASVRKEYILGCAMNFLWDLSPVLASLHAKRQLLPQKEHADLPLNFVSVHLRFGDQNFWHKGS